jgi:TRAP-type uncharacterized transport system fused permease subunit
LKFTGVPGYTGKKGKSEERVQGGVMRELRGNAAVLIGVLYAAFVGWSVYGAIVPIETHTFRMLHLGFIFALAFFAYPVSKNAGRWSMWMDIGLAALGVATIVYPLTHHRSRIDPRPEDGAGTCRRRGPGEDLPSQPRGFSQERL